ncbi:MAG: DMT family transporter [Patescibacteria group bacterium]
MWFIFALLGYFFLAFVGLTDKFIINKSVPKPAVFTFYSCALVFVLVFLIPFGIIWPIGFFDWLMVFLCGGFFVLGLWTMYIGMKNSEVSHYGPLVGASTAFFVILLSCLFLQEDLTVKQWWAVALLIFGSLLISFEKSKDHDGLHRGMLWGILCSFLFAASHIAAKYIYNIYDFYSGFVWTRAAMGVFGFLFLLSPSVRQSIFGHRIKTAIPVFKQFFLVSINKFLAIAGIILTQYAIALGSVSIVNALAGVQYALLVIVVALISKFIPRWFEEKYANGEMAQELASVIIIGIGLSLLI